MTVLIACLLVAALFFAALLNLAAENRFRSRITGYAAAVAAVTGIVLYSYGFITEFGFGPIAMLRALFAVCRMFGGVNDLASVQGAPWFTYDSVLTVFWTAHFLAFYVTASTAIASLGGKLLTKLRTMMLKRGDLTIVYGVNAESLAYARRRLKMSKTTLLFVDETCSSADESQAQALGTLVEKSTSAVSPDTEFLKRAGIRPGKRKLLVAAMDEDPYRNLVWAQKLLASMAEKGVDPLQTSLLIRGVGEDRASELLAMGGPGFGNVYAYDAYSLAARLMIRKLPPYETLKFGKTGRAEEDFHGVVIGFGQMGRAVLGALVMNGQFAGSGFHLDIFDAKIQPGNWTDSPLLKEGSLRFHAAGGRSDEFYGFLSENRRKLKYIAVCTGNRRENEETARELREWYGKASDRPVIVQITKNSLICAEAEPEYVDIAGSDALDIEKTDRFAMRVNQRYCRGNGKTAEENWKKCDYFSRMSCRAFSDFSGAFAKAAGVVRDGSARDAWMPSGELLENLAETEHMRWCAFHEVMGYRPMSETVWKERAALYEREKAEKGVSGVRIGKDTENRLHACIVPWNELNELSRKENAVTGGYVDYKQMDRENVLLLGDLLKEA